MRIGPFIKLHRIEQGMTQEKLALGIVSVSYLSKIENEHTNASEEVIQMLSERLHINPNEGNDQELREECQRWYGMLYEVNDQEEIIELYEKIQKQMHLTLVNELLLFEIHVVRYYLVIGSYTKALDQINKLSEIEDTFDCMHAYYWHKFKGNYHSIYHAFNEAMKMYKQAEEVSNRIELSKHEQADLSYTISVTHSKLRNTLETIEYAEAGLQIFREQYNFIRCAQCHLLLGISYRRIRLHEKAVENYNLAKKLGEVNNNRQVIQLANQNLGYLHSANGNSSQAISHYEEVVKDPGVDLNARLPAITSLIKEYHLISELKKTREMVSKGLQLLEQVESRQAYQLYYYMIYTYKHMLDGEMQAFEKIVIHSFLPYLVQHKDYVNIIVYTKMLANYYEKVHKYKDALFYHKQASDAYEQLTNI